MIWMAWKTVKEILRERRTVAFLLIAPVLIMTLIYFALATQTDPKIQIIARGTSRMFVGEFENALRNEDAQIVSNLSNDKITGYENIKKMALQTIDQGLADAVVYLDENMVDIRTEGERGNIYLFLEGTSSITTAKVLKAVSASMDDLGEALPNMGDESCSNICLDSFNNKALNLEKVYQYTSDDYEDIDYFIPFFPAFIIFFLTFISATIFFQRERVRGTLKYLLTTPLSLSKLYWGFNLGFTFFSLFQIIIVMTFSLYLYGQPVSFTMILSWMILILITQQTAVFTGLLCSLLSKTEFQALQFIPLVILPQIFLSNMIWPLKDLPIFLQKIAPIFPLTQINLSVVEIIIKKKNFLDSWQSLVWPLFILFILIGVFHIVGQKTLNRE